MVRMRMGWRVGCALGLVLICARAGAAGPASAPTTLPATGAQEVLKSKGLTRVGRVYLLQEDIKFPEALRRLLAAKKGADDDMAKRAALEKDIRAAKAAVDQLNVQLREVSEQRLKRGQGEVYKRNQLGAEMNVIIARLHEGEKYVAAREEELGRMSGEPQDKYAAAVVALSGDMEATLKRYEALAADAEVTAALRKLDAADPAKLALGPSEQFKRELVFVRNQQGKVATGVVKFKFDRNVPEVLVTLNGVVTTTMILDSGASMVSIPADVAQQLGVKPGPNDPTATFRIANGKTVEAKIVTLQSVRLGQFTAENVTCGILPASAGSTEGLLGGTFLQNFVYRMDMASRELHLTQVSAKPAAAPSSAVNVESAPTSPAASGGSTKASVPKVEEGFTALFNGKDLTGWTYGADDRGEQKTGNGYQVKDGKIYSTRDDGGNLFTEKAYSNFVLRFEFKLSESANNGIGIRTPPTGDPAYVGMEIQVLDNTGKQYTDKAGRSKLRPEQLHGSIYDVVAAKPGSLKPVGEWNAEEIRAEGRRISVVLNGNTILSADLDAVKDAGVLKRHPGLTNERGRIGLLGHGSAVVFRNVRIKELGAPAAGETPAAAEDLFDGKSLAGWAGDRKLWGVVDGTIRGKSAADGETYLFCDRGGQKNFNLDLEFKLVSGNSGVLFRGEMTPEFGKAGGYEADLYSPNAMGKLAVGRDVVFRPSAEAQKQAFKPGEWNRYTVEAEGERIRIWMNGQLLTDVTDKGPEAGRIGLQLYGPTEVYFRDIKLRTFP